jgi:hypothetical protein
VMLICFNAWIYSGQDEASVCLFRDYFDTGK